MLLKGCKLWDVALIFPLISPGKGVKLYYHRIISKMSILQFKVASFYGMPSKARQEVSDVCDILIYRYKIHYHDSNIKCSYLDSRVYA